MQVLTQEQFQDWFQSFEAQQNNQPETFLGRAFILAFLDHENQQLFHMQNDEEALRYILSSYVDIELLAKAAVLA